MARAGIPAGPGAPKPRRTDARLLPVFHGGGGAACPWPTPPVKFARLRGPTAERTSREGPAGRAGAPAASRPAAARCDDAGCGPFTDGRTVAPEAARASTHTDGGEERDGTRTGRPFHLWKRTSPFICWANLTSTLKKWVNSSPHALISEGGSRFGTEDSKLTAM